MYLVILLLLVLLIVILWARRSAFQTLDAVVVASKYKEDTEWMKKLKYPYVIYTKNENEVSKYNIPVNKGNEASVYFKYIIDHYDSLPSYVFFIHAHESDWHHKSSMASKINDMNLDGNYKNLNDTEYQIVVTYKNGITIFNGSKKIVEHEHNNYAFVKMEEWYNENMKDYLGPLKYNSIINVDLCCAQFLVSRETIRKLPLEFYKKQYDWLMNTDVNNYYSGRFYEWTWGFIFKNTAVL